MGSCRRGLGGEVVVSVCLNPTARVWCRGTVGRFPSAFTGPGWEHSCRAEQTLARAPEGQLRRRAQTVAQEGFLGLQDPLHPGPACWGAPPHQRAGSAVEPIKEHNTETGLRQVEGRDEPAGGSSQQTARKTGRRGVRWETAGQAPVSRRSARGGDTRKCLFSKPALDVANSSCYDNALRQVAQRLGWLGQQGLLHTECAGHLLGAALGCGQKAASSLGSLSRPGPGCQVHSDPPVKGRAGGEDLLSNSSVNQLVL